MLDVLQSLPVWQMAIVVAGMTVTLSVLCVGLVEVLLPAQRRQRVNEVAGFILAVAGVLYAVPLALITAEAWDDFSDARDAVQREAEQIARAATLATLLPQPIQGQVVSGLATYARSVIMDEWPTMARGMTPFAAEGYLVSIRDLLEREAQRETAPNPRLDRAIGHVDELIHARIERLLTGHQALIAPVWWLVCMGAVLTLFFCAIFAVEDRTLHHLLGVLVALAIALVVILLLATDRPFYGKSRISPEPIQQVLDRRWGGATLSPVPIEPAPQG
jgi:hypothetical protein